MKSRFGDSLTVDQQFLWFAETAKDRGDVSVSTAIKTALNLSSSLANKRGVFVQSDFDDRNLYAKIDELKLIQTIIQTINSGIEQLEAGSILHVEVRVDVFTHVLSLSVITFTAEAKMIADDEHIIQNVLEREYLKKRQEFAEFQAFKIT